jgi:Uncharacterized conserved protein (COG2071)
MRLPVIRGVIRRRLLVNFRVDPEVMRAALPPPFFPKLHAGWAVAGICLIRLEEIRPAGLPAIAGISSENMAHRIAVHWQDPDGSEREGVFIPRRDTDSWLNHIAGGRVFPGEHGLADFAMEDDGDRISMFIQSRDGSATVRVDGREAENLPVASCFTSLAEASAFFECGAVGYSVTRDCGRFDGIRLQTKGWRAKPLEIERVESSYFADTTRFPSGSAVFDHALVMRNLPHEWHGEPDIVGSTRSRRPDSKVGSGRSLRTAIPRPFPATASGK